MSTERDGPPPDQVKVHDLRQGLSRDQSGPGSQHQRALLRLGSVLLAAALIAAALFVGTRGPATTLPRPTPTVTPAASFLPLAGLSCVNDAAWSPAGDLVAFVGPTSPGCGRGGELSHMVNLYRVQPPRLLRHLLPDDAAFAALGLSNQVSTTPGVRGTLGVTLTYTTVRWSPDATQLALSFTALVPSTTPGWPLYIYGVALLNADGSHERVLVDQEANPRTAYAIWDLQAGRLVPVLATTVPGDAPFSTLVPAQSYSWGADGALALGAPFPSAPGAQPYGLVGSPIRVAPFGPWQPGTITVLQEPLTDKGPLSYLYLYQTTFDAWSPDGRSFAEGLDVQRLVAPPGAPLPPWAASALPPQLLQMAPMPIRDAALAQALTQDMLSGPDNNPAPIAWRQDGKALAELTLHNGYIIRATDTGRVVQSVSLMQVPAETTLQPMGLPGTWDAPLWSPDGKWLLLPTLALVNTSHVGL